MNITQARLNQYNKVVVFRELRFTQVLIELARRLLPEHSSPLITEIPNQLLSVVYPDRRIDCQFANRRVLISDKRGITPGEHPFGIIAINAIAAAAESSGGHQGIIAYGYNYNIELSEAGATQYVNARFFNDATRISQIYGGELRNIGFVANVNIPNRNCFINLSLLPNSNSTNIIDIQVNYDYQGQSPPLAIAEVSQQAIEQYDEVKRVLSQL